VLALKEALALAAVLNWTVVATGFWPHSSELAAAAGLSLEAGGIRGSRRLRHATAATAAGAATTFAAGASGLERNHWRRGLAGGKAAAQEVPRRRSRHRHQQPHPQRRQQQPQQELDGAAKAGEQMRKGAAASIIPFDMIFDR
jgi:hypothetical protein